MKAKETEKLSKEAQLLKKLRDEARALDEENKRKAWVAKLVAMPEFLRDFKEEEFVETPHLFQTIAKRILEEGI